MRFFSGLLVVFGLAAGPAVGESLAKLWTKPCCTRQQVFVLPDSTKVFTTALVDSARLRNNGDFKAYPRARVDSTKKPAVCTAGYVVDVTQTSLSIQTGQSDSLFATVTRCGVSVPNVIMTWTSRNTNVVPAISSTGKRVLVTTNGAGTTQVVATSDGGGADSATVTVTTPPLPDGFFVATNGTAGGSGTSASPWSLAKALDSPAGVSAGDTIWVRGGTYTASSWTNTNTAGTSVSKLVFKAYPGERPRINGPFTVNGDNTAFWGLEFYQSAPITSGNGLGVNDRAPGTLWIHNIFHDAGQSCVGSWMEAPNSVVYGNIVYNCGTHENLDHGIYFQNSTGTKLIADNIVFNNLAYGLHGFTSGQQSLLNTTLRGNVSFNNGTIATGYSERPDYLIGASSGSPTIDEITIDSNYSFRNTVSEETADIGWHFGQAGGDLVFTDNHMVGTRFMNTWASVDSTPANTQRTSFPGSGELVIVRPSLYDINRGNVIIYNWGLASTVGADLSSILSVGQSYVIKNVLDFWGSDVLSGTYAGGEVEIPMQAVSPPALLGRTYDTAPTPGPRFGVFVVIGS